MRFPVSVDLGFVGLARRAFLLEEVEVAAFVRLEDMSVIDLLIAARCSTWLGGFM
jgi:hypothetical protein